MKALVLIGVLALYSVAAELDLEEWSAYKLKHGKSYDDREDSKRRDAYETNKELIEEHNKRFAAGLESYKQTINYFTDQSEDEFDSIMLGPELDESQAAAEYVQISFRSDTPAPESMDWRDSHAVTPVKDQKRCNSCWAFATMGALESHLYLKTKKLRSLSAQYLVDCSNRKPYGNSACHGGGLVSSYEFIKDKGACTTDSYRYKGKQRACNYGCRIGAKIDDIVALTDASEEELKDIVGNIGPIAVTINANSWKQYSQSVFNNKNCDTTSNHAVLIVGYGHDNQTGLDYWLLKNSWGADWGERGYMRLARNKQNQCGIGKIAAYPIVAV